jgi:tetratricopeptide (TPR) repeat protein
MTHARSLAAGRTALIAIAACAAIAMVRPGLAARYHELRETSDVYPFGSPEHVVVQSLGYRAAFADAIFAHLRVSYGLHFQEHRRLEFVGDYLDTAIMLDPSFRDPYQYAETFLVFSPEAPRIADYERAREIMLRGIKAFPYDDQVWLSTGQFLAYQAPPFLPDVNKKREWRLEGAKILSRACELASRNENIPYNCIGAARLLQDAGEREAAIDSLRRLIEVTDNPEIQKLALGYLAKRLDARDKERAELRREQFRTAWHADLPFVTKDFILVVGPRFDPARCAGVGGGRREGCSTSWKAWREEAERGLAK